MANNAPKRFDETTTETTSLQKDSNEYVGIAQNNVSKKILTSNLMTKANVGLGNVDNTADTDKPISTAVQEALDDKANSDDVANALANKQDKAITIDEQATTVESAIQANFDSIEDLQAQIDGKVYGIRVNHVTGEVIRTGNAVGMNFGSPDGINPIESDFDNVFPWSDIYTLKIDSEGVKKYQSEDDYSTFDGSMYAHIPSFYIRDITIGDIRNISVSNKALKGYTKVSERYVGCFHAGYENGELISKVEKAVKVNTSYTGFHNILDTQDGVYMYDMTTFHAIVALSYIEMGSLDHKTALGLGIQSGMPYGSSGYDIKVATTDANTVTVDSSLAFYTGMLVQVGTSYTNNSIASDRYITDIVDNGDGTQTLTLDGDSFSVSVGNTCVTWAQPVSQEAVDAIGDGSGYYLQFGSQARSHVCYRGIWNLYGNAWQLVAGFMRYDGQYYGCADPTKMNVTTPVGSDGWSDLGIGGYTDNGYQRIRKAVEIDGGYIDVPVEWGSEASSNTFYSAYLYSFSSTYTGARVLRLGGSWGSGSNVSPVCSYGGFTPSDSSIGAGSRVIRYN